MPKRSYRDLFLERLTDLSEGEPRLIGNTTLREALKWDEERYSRVKAQLLVENIVIAGRGRGGSVGLADAADSSPLKLFLSYSHLDEGIKVELLKHLEPLKRLKLIDVWHDRQLAAGDEWEGKIANHLEEADIILLLVSIDFINSKYCYDIELERALERHAQEAAVVVPIIVRNCMWQHTPFAKLQALPKDAKAISAWQDQDDALTNVAEGIRQVAEQLRNAKEDFSTQTL